MLNARPQSPLLRTAGAATLLTLATALSASPAHAAVDPSREPVEAGAPAATSTAAVPVSRTAAPAPTAPPSAPSAVATPSAPTSAAATPSGPTPAARATAAAAADTQARRMPTDLEYRKPRTTAPWTPPADASTQISDAVRKAVDYGVDAGYGTGIAVVDMKTGGVYTGGQATGHFPTESTIKVLLAANLLATGQMSGSVEALATQMITTSDDDAADALYWRAGGDGVLDWAANRYGIDDLGTGPVFGSGWWGSFTISPVGFAQFLAAAYADPAVGPWLASTMGRIQPTAADGTDQRFGLFAADPSGAIKQGWGGDVVGGDAIVTPSVGWIADRYAVALFTMHVPDVGFAASAAVTTAQAQLLLAGLH